TTIYIKPSTGLAALNLRDLWTYRELVFFMIWRDIKVRYKQTLLGAAWAIIQPLMTMLVFNFIFGSVAKVPTEGIPYPIFSYTALLPWGLFTTALNQASRSLTSNHNMITKIYFPRLVLPVASVLAGLIDFAIAFVILIGLMIYYGAALKEVGFVYEILFFVAILVFSFEKGWVSRLFKKSTFLEKVGTYSYSIYMTHSLLISIFNILFIRILKFPPSAYWYLVFANYYLIYKVSEWTYKNIEMRFKGGHKKISIKHVSE
ncbi:MAG: hypothetical protein ACK41O_21320, partial [Runella zeae]